jgi:hypothetical protein
MQSHTRIIELLVSLCFRAALASEASGQRGNFLKVRAPDTRPEPGSSARGRNSACCKVMRTSETGH